jgi:ketosteroid isomerase-like protein
MEVTVNNDLHDFEQFMQRREDVARAYVRGDPAPLGRIVAREGKATFFAPQGGYVAGAEDVFSTYQHDAAAFEPGGESRFEILQMAASDGLAYWVGFQRATAHLRGHTEAVPFNLRVTEVFRREGDDWKLVHRHADPLAAVTKQQNK